MSTTKQDKVVRTYHEVYQRITKENPAAGEVMTYCALLAPEAIPESIFIAGASAFEEPLQSLASNLKDWRNVVWLLSRYSLLERTKEGDAFMLPYVLQEMIRDTLDEAQRFACVKRLVKAISLADYIQYWFWDNDWEVHCQRLLPHWRICVGYINQYKIETVVAEALLDQIGFYLKECRLMPDADVNTDLLYVRAVEIIETLREGDRPDIATNLMNLASLYLNQGWLTEAESLLIHALEIKEQVLGTEHRSTRNTRDYLTYLRQEIQKSEA